MLRVFQVALERRTLEGWQLGEDLLLVTRLEVFEKVGRIVRLERRHGLRQELVGQRLHELVAHRRLELRKNLEIEARSERLNEANTLFGIEQFDEIGQVGRFQVRHERTNA